MTRVVVDTDPGTDDVLALMMAFGSPDVDVVGLTTVGGNARLADTTRNTLRLLEYLGRTDVPVFKGSSRPMRGKYHYGYDFHGATGLTVRLPPSSATVKAQDAASFIVEVADSAPDDVTLIALGPLTNVARAVQAEPRTAQRLKEVIVMGGAGGVPGNVTPYAEFNTYNDPLAAEILFSSAARVTLVGLDVCDRVFVRRDQAGAYSGPSPAGRLTGNILQSWFQLQKDRDRYNLCDPMAIVAMLDPGALSCRSASVRVETNDQARYGETSATFGDGPVSVAVDVDVPRAQRLIRGLVGAADCD